MGMQDSLKGGCDAFEIVWHTGKMNASLSNATDGSLLRWDLMSLVDAVHKICSIHAAAMSAFYNRLLIRQSCFPLSNSLIDPKLCDFPDEASWQISVLVHAQVCNQIFEGIAIKQLKNSLTFENVSIIRFNMDFDPTMRPFSVLKFILRGDWFSIRLWPAQSARLAVECAGPSPTTCQLSLILRTIKRMGQPWQSVAFCDILAGIH